MVSGYQIPVSGNWRPKTNKSDIIRHNRDGKSLPVHTQIPAPHSDKCYIQYMTFTLHSASMKISTLVSSLIPLAILVLASCNPELADIDDDDIGGVVNGSEGPEAGVWVIAETFDLPARFAKTVVTNDEGKYVLPDLPPANYKVWVRGYGLVDSPKEDAKPGTTRPSFDAC